MKMAPGTEPFVAPEVRKLAESSPRSDMFSFGVTLVRVLLPLTWESRMPKTTAKVLEIFDKDRDDDALSKHLLEERITFDRTVASDKNEGAKTVKSAVDEEELKQLSDVLSKLLGADPTKRLSAQELLDHPFFAAVRLVEAPSLTPQTPPRILNDGLCKVYQITHAGEQARGEASWEHNHFNEAAVQFHLMMGASTNKKVKEVLVCVNDTLTATFEAKREAYKSEGKPTSEIWVFHGTGSQENVDSIITNGFRIPPAGQEAHGAAHGRGICKRYLSPSLRG